MQTDPLTPDDHDLEQVLRLLPPAADGPPLNPTTAAYTAGRRSARRQLQLWRSATAAALLVPFATHYLSAPPSPAAAPLALHPATLAAPPISPQTVWMLEDSVSRHGLAGLGGVQVPDYRPIRSNDKL